MTQIRRVRRPAQLLLLAGLFVPFWTSNLAQGWRTPAGDAPFSPTSTTGDSETPVDESTLTPALESATPAELSPTPEAATPADPSPTPATESLTPTIDNGSATPSPTSTDPSPTASPDPPTATDDIPPSPTPTPSSTAISSQTPVPSPGPAPTAIAALTLLINEVAWGGTDASSADEWIELHNPGPDPVSLQGWTLTDHMDINKSLQGVVPPYGFFLMERTDDSTIADIAADLTYTGSLNNTGDSLWLIDPSGNTVDSANGDGGPWPAGTSHASMERRGGDDRSGNWGTFPGFGGNGHDVDGNPIHGSPHEPNAIDRPTPTSVAPTLTLSASDTPTSTPTATGLPQTPIPPLSVLINEVAWAGTSASSSDEWIELHNPGPAVFDLGGWTLTDGGDVVIGLRGRLGPFGFYLLERSDDRTIADIPADQIYSGNLNNAGEVLRLLDPSGAVIDSANGDGGRWPAGNDSSRTSMERRGDDDRSGNWATFTGYHGNGHDADGNAIRGSPRALNSIDLPTPVPTGIPSGIVINEVLVRPHYDWEGTGGVNTGDEFIELFNTGLLPVDLQGWSLDDVAGDGSRPFVLPRKIIPPGGFAIFFHTRTHISLNDTGDSVRLLDPSDHVIDGISYLRIRAANLSYGRFPDGSQHMRYGLWPTAGQPNEIFLEPGPVTSGRPGIDCRGGHLHPVLPRLARSAPLIRWLRASAPVACH